MICKVSFIFALILSNWIVNKSEGGVSWKRDKTFDDVIRVDSSSHTEERRAVSVVCCASLCTSSSWCSSFFFLPTAVKCLLNELVFAKPGGGQSSPGAQYFKADSEDCRSLEGYVWLRRLHMCFKVYSLPMTFIYAYETCTNDGSRLVVLDTADKRKAVATYNADKYVPIRRAFIGGVRDGVINGTRTTWDNDLDPLYWLNGVKVATSGPDGFWKTANPDNQFGIEGCMEIFYGLFNDLECRLAFPFICENVLN